MKQKVQILYSPSTQFILGIDLNIDLKGHEWTRNIGYQILDGLITIFYKKAEGDGREAPHSFFFRADGVTTRQNQFMIAQKGDQKVPQDQLDTAAQEIYDQIIAPQLTK